MHDALSLSTSVAKRGTLLEVCISFSGKKIERRKEVIKTLREYLTAKDMPRADGFAKNLKIYSFHSPFNRTKSK